jgi:hypothetical protein
MGKKNQLYAKYVRLMQSAEKPNEIYLVLEKDEPMEKKYMRQFDNMFMGKDVIITITPLIREKNKHKTGQKEEEEIPLSPFWDVET